MVTFNPSLCRNESEVESKLIVQYLLPELGYSPENWHQEVAFGSIRLDFLAFATQVVPFVLGTDSPLCLVIEAKSPRENLDRHTRRLKTYLMGLNVHLGLLTNGKELRIYKRNQNDLSLVFSCPGESIESRIDEIRSKVGRDVLQNRHIDSTVESAAPYLDNSNFIEEKDVKVIAIYHNKGGVGKTTVSVNLAAALRNKGYRTLLIDLDSQANSTFATGLIKFQFEEDDTLKDCNVSHVIQSRERYSIPEVALESSFFNDPELDVLPSHINLIERQFELNKIQTSTTRLIQKLDSVKSEYDFVIIDTPPSRDLYAKVALIAANYLLIPSDLKPFANQGLQTVKAFIADIDEFRSVIGKKNLVILGVLPSKISTNAASLKSTFPKQKQSIIERHKLPVLDSVIYDRVALSHCLNQSVIVGDLEVPDPKSIFSYVGNNASVNQSMAEFEALADEIMSKVK